MPEWGRELVTTAEGDITPTHTHFVFSVLHAATVQGFLGSQEVVRAAQRILMVSGWAGLFFPGLGCVLRPAHPWLTVTKGQAHLRRPCWGVAGHLRAPAVGTPSTPDLRPPVLGLTHRPPWDHPQGNGLLSPTFSCLSWVLASLC